MSDGGPARARSGDLPRPAKGRTPDEAVRRWVAAALDAAGASAALVFVEAVVSQTAVPLGQEPPPGGRAMREVRVAETVLELLLLRDDEVVESARRLRADPTLLAAFFQNLDLLPLDGWDGADRIAALVMAALEEA